MLRKVDKHSGVPAYIQIMNDIKKEILLGRLKDGDRLPPVRKMADIFGVNTNTVLHSLERLQFEGLLEAEHGVGYFVKVTNEVGKEAIEIIERMVAELKEKGIDLEMAKVLLEEVWKNA
ncbi:MULTISPECIES: GntR family transcriptional regulator [Kosmotoga]|uniref:Transcriptional regulator, GntR family n=1 Tax=Kosmotoga olearia (strain ATCC BAA-1733 / DSM 21960 / TBF 19.5.1) TaxID=521045 RepID=C5CF95_KOSOT|nr:MULTISPECIES: winged helix-turn-helix domain-containing protein [Kosmotoga]ACR79372.1 transcriptional regulator, GntR family [Kosmotoga olearia TBF 19.5.1]OAA22754.1 transcriptional regulator [Kosmotoga sp. DU53]